LFKVAYLLLLVVSQSNALEMRSQKALITSHTATSFTAQLKPGFHFNEKAPNGISSLGSLIKPKEISAQKLTFEYDSEPSEATVQIYVCDDAVTFCETHNIPLNVTAKKKRKKEKPAPNQFGKTNSHGFIQDDLKGALDKAKKQKKLVLIDFSARWCPSCQRLDREVFGAQEFKKYQKNFVMVSLDTDRFQNAILAEKFKILGVPTIILATADQQVLAHILDYQPLNRFEELLAYVVKDPTPMNMAPEALAQASEEQKKTLGFRNFYGGMYENANTAWSAMKEPPQELLSSQYWDASGKFNKELMTEKDYKSFLESLVKKDPTSGRSLAWRIALMDLKSSSDREKERWFKDGVALAEKISSTPEGPKNSLQSDLQGDLAGHEDFIIAVNRAELFSGFKHKDAELAWKKAVTVGEGSRFNPEDLGPSLRFLSVMNEAKDWEKAQAWVAKLKAAHPANGDLLRRETKILVELKDFKNAVKIGEEALKKSYERNHFWVVEYLAKAYQGNKQPHKAKSLIDTYLKKPEIEAKSLNSTKKSLVKLQGEITL
jgi:thioredoxin-related protein